MKINKTIGTLFFILLFFSSYGQCRSFTKKHCLPELSPYMNTGQMNTVNLFAGDEADLLLTFYSGQNYRLFVCAQEVLGDVTYRILDKEQYEIYNSEGKPSQLFDFKVKSTQQLRIEVTVPESSNTHDMDFQGCVSVLVGYKP